MDQKLRLQIQVRTLGVAIGVREDGGIMDVVQRTLEVECLPADIPEHLDIDVSALRIGDQVRLADIASASNVDFLQAPDTVVITLVAPKAEEEVDEDAAAAEGAEPELIGKGKEDEAEGDESKPKGDS